MSEEQFAQLENAVNLLKAASYSLEAERTKYRTALEKITNLPVELREIPTGSAYNQGKAFQIAVDALR